MESIQDILQQLQQLDIIGLIISASDNNGRAKVLYGRNSKSTPRNLTTNYFIKYFDKCGDVLNRFDEDVSKIIDVWNINGPPLVPESYGTEQKVLVDLHNIQQDKIFYFGIQGVDEAGNKGIVSNVVAVFFSSNSVFPTVSHSFSLDSTMSSSTQDPAADKKIKLNKGGLSTGNIAVIVSLVLLLLIIILVVLVFFCKRKSKNKKMP
ncbi:uncharacterized protein LOC143258614 [Tachypleus tridentatus]|uniref:uncharacterized protein LOC143258614 n=1 Tax=Tachypleus tridentatus TaxID=6853 RepID=UPI003FD16944